VKIHKKEKKKGKTSLKKKFVGTGRSPLTW